MFDETKNNGENLDFTGTPNDDNTIENENVNEVLETTEISEVSEVTETEEEMPSAQEPMVAEEVIHEGEATPIEAEKSFPTVDNSEIKNSYEWNSGNFENPNVPQKKKKQGSGFKVFVAVMLSIFTLSSLLLVAMVTIDVVSDGNFSFNIETYSGETPPVQNEAQNQEFDYNSITIDTPNYVAFDFKQHEGQVLSIPEIAAKCSPSSVGIISEIETSVIYPFYFSPTTRIAEASGSGFVYSEDGYIITNHHVIEDATKIKVVLYDNKEYEAELVGSDALSDIAVLKIEPDESTKLIPMEIGNSDELVVGESVVAIGCPAGIEFIGTVTDGIISAINRNVEITDGYGNIQKTMTLIQTNATINHGNSGGPLINTRGQVIGINTLKLSSNYEGVGFSIPISGAVPVIKQLIEHGEVVERTEEDFAYGKGMIGISGSAISETESEYYGIPQGVLVVQIDRDASAAAAGLRRGDIITHYNGTEVKSIDEINTLKDSARAGTVVTLTIYRDGDNGSGETLDITFKLDAQK